MGEEVDGELALAPRMGGGAGVVRIRRGEAIAHWRLAAPAPVTCREREDLLSWAVAAQGEVGEGKGMDQFAKQWKRRDL